jgi:hypothetical protein
MRVPAAAHFTVRFPNGSQPSVTRLSIAAPHKALYDRVPQGAVAQLGERYTGSVEVRGSIPLGSTRDFKGLGPGGRKDLGSVAPEMAP